MEYTAKEETQLLSFLINTIPNISKSKAKSLLKYKQVSVNGEPVTSFDYNIRPGHIVKISKCTKEQAASRAIIDIVYEDSDLIAISKPCGLLSVSTGKAEETTAYRLVTAYVRAKNAGSRIFIVHRLDRDTSGILLFAKNEKIKRLLQSDWNNIVTARSYYAIVEGILDEKNKVITSWLTEDKNHVIYSSNKAGGGKLAVTEYTVLKETPKYSLLDVAIKTG